MTNPFIITSPEQMNARLAQQLFVEVSSDFPQVKNPGHSLIVGARGSGKSMMIRCLQPDVMKLSPEGPSFSELEFLSFYIPIKNTELRITELQHLEKHHAASMINEHFFVVDIMMHIFRTLKDMSQSDLPFSDKEYNEFFTKIYKRRLKLYGCRTECEYIDTSAPDFFEALYNHMEELHFDVLSYIRSIDITGNKEAPSYNLPLFTYLGFIVPVIKAINNLPGFPQKYVYLFIDDADNLSKTQTQILNTWLSSRTAPEISLKVSTQIGNYKSFTTTNGTWIESPHDYQEINISDLYTSNSTSYYRRVYRIVEKRLHLAGLDDVRPEDFFPPYEVQEKLIKEEEKKIIRDWPEKGRGNKPADDAKRYARANYISNLGGTRKQRSSYMYAGFETLVHLSSGIVRNFLDSAATMYDNMIKATGNEKIKSISHTIQNDVAKAKAADVLFSNFKRIELDEEVLTGELKPTDKLQNLVFAMGRTFHDRLVTKSNSERKVFSIALTNMPTPDIAKILELGVQTGYLHVSSIGMKDGSGKTWLYVLNRILSPQFVLDPTGFAGYLFVTNSSLLEAMNTGKKFRELPEDKPDQLSFFTIQIGDDLYE